MMLNLMMGLRSAAITSSLSHINLDTYIQQRSVADVSISSVAVRTGTGVNSFIFLLTRCLSNRKMFISNPLKLQLLQASSHNDRNGLRSAGEWWEQNSSKSTQLHQLVVPSYEALFWVSNHILLRKCGLKCDLSGWKPSYNLASEPRWALSLYIHA